LDHPLILEENSKLRRRVIQLARSSYSVKREGNIVFVCGGSGPTDMRTRFRDYCFKHHPDFEIFFAEFAMRNYFSNGHREQFDLAAFEELVGELSHAIVLFPEAPGSYAETGYFSAVDKLASNTILAMDAHWQGKDSFISMGPARKIGAVSRFDPVIQTPYKQPAFEDIASRVLRFPFSKTMKQLAVDTFRALSTYELFCLLHKCFSLLTIATIDDILFLVNGIFSGQISKPKIKHITSVLVGANYLIEIGTYGHYRADKTKGDLLKLRTGCAHEEASILV
jgi:hypothetical protein